MISQKILNPLKNLLLKRRYRHSIDPLAEFNKLKVSADIPLPTKGNILIAPIRMSATAHLFEGYIAYALRLKGYKVYALLCGQGLNDCENKPLSTAGNLKCSVCYAEQIKFYQTFNIEPLWISDWISKSAKADINKCIKTATIDKIMLKNINLTGYVISGIMRVLKLSKIDNNHLPLIKKFSRTAAMVFTATDLIIKELKISHVLLSHGVYSTWGPVIKACSINGVNPVVWGRGYVGNGNIMATHKDSYLLKNIIEPTTNYDHIKLSHDQVELVKKYFRDKRNPKLKADYISYYAGKKINSKIDVYSEFNLDKTKKIFGLFPNIPWDGQLFNATEGFPSIRDFIKTTIDWFQGKDAYLIIRGHPAEIHNRAQGQLEIFSDILNEVCPELPENVIFVAPDHEISSYQLEEHIVCAILYAGTIGLEFAMNNTPVIQVGRHFNSGKGFIFEPKNNEDYYDFLHEALRGNLTMTKTMKQATLKYAYHWVFRRHIPEQIIQMKNGLEFESYNLESADELEKNEIVNWFIDKMITKTPFIYYPKTENEAPNPD